MIVSNETPELEAFTLCILQQNDCFGCDAPILDRPRVPLLDRWRGVPLDAAAARALMVGHLDLGNGDGAGGGGGGDGEGKPWSWKVVVGANPAYDAFPVRRAPRASGARRSMERSLPTERRSLLAPVKEPDDGDAFSCTASTPSSPA